jgi:hypothetical protein
VIEAVAIRSASHGTELLHAGCWLVELHYRLVIVAQLAEHRVVVPKVAGSSPVGHPAKFPAKHGKTESLQNEMGAF